MAAKHEERAHALLSASAARRWLNCTVSARLAEQFENKSSEYAMEGTFAHELGELELRHRTNGINAKEFKSKLATLKENKYYSPALHEYVMVYVTYVLASLSESQAVDPKSELLIEKKIDFSRYVPEGFGSNDAIVAGAKKIKVIDLKFGMGLKVEAALNPQLMLYALGAYLEMGEYEEYDTVSMVIVQPRLDWLSEFEMPITELLDWAENVLKPKALEAHAGGGTFCAGDWCKFCPAKPQCSALAKANLELAKLEFAEPKLLTSEQIAEVLGKLDMLTDWAGAVKTYALSAALSGTKWPGYKVVEGRSSRKFTDLDVVAGLLDFEGYTDEQLFRKSLIPMGEVEKLLGKKDFEAVLKEWVVKTPGSPTLVKESDKRPEFNNLARAKAEFKD